MASIGSACRLSARIANRQLRNHASRRGFRAAAANMAAHNFAMPALSPTMTEGNIATWKLKEGDSFSAGDVILEIETDKATMDVEAQDDGILAKIIQGDGSKSVQVGTRIAVLAEPGDDISSLEIPAEDTAPKSKPEPVESSPTKEEHPPAAAPKSSSSASAGPKAAGKATKQTYPLYPSVLQLLKENGMGKEDADKIPASGPNGRLLKGDVLSYLGKIESSYSAEQSARISKLGHLDLSNIKLAAPPKPTPAASAPAPTPLPEEDLDTEIALPISFSAVLDCQKRIQDTLGIFLPVATFVARAIELANEDLPASSARKSPSADDLFNAVLGLPPSTPPPFSRGAFMPQITALAAAQPPPARQAIVKAKPADVYDVLTGGKSRTSVPLELPLTKHMKGAVNVFSVVAPKGDEKRAVVFLERVKTVLEAEPGRLVL